MTRKIDPVAVRQEAQARAVRSTDIYAYSEWKQMHDLYHLRRELRDIQINCSIEPESLALAPQVRHLIPSHTPRFEQHPSSLHPAWMVLDFGQSLLVLTHIHPLRYTAVCPTLRKWQDT